MKFLSLLNDFDHVHIVNGLIINTVKAKNEAAHFFNDTFQNLKEFKPYILESIKSIKLV